MTDEHKTKSQLIAELADLRHQLAQQTAERQLEVAEYQQAAEALRASERLNQKIVAMSPNLVYIYDLAERKNVFVNRELAVVLGYPAEQAPQVGSVFLPADVHPDDAPILSEKLDWLGNALEGEIVSREYRVRRADGDWCWLGTREMVFSRSSAGKPCQIMGIAHDVTERKRTEHDLELLAQAGRELSTTLNLRQIYTTLHRIIQRAMPCAFLSISSYDVTTQLIRCEYGSGPQGEFDVTAYPRIPLEAEGRGTQSLVIRSGEPLLLNDYAAYVRTATTTYYVTDDGQLAPDRLAEEESPRSALIVPLKLDGQVVGVIQAFSIRQADYTPRNRQFLESLALHVSTVLTNARLFAQIQNELAERQQAQDALRASEAFSRAILDNSPIGISVRSQTGRLLSANVAWQKIWAIPEAALRADYQKERPALVFDARDNYLQPHQAEIRRVYEHGGSYFIPQLKTVHPRPGAAAWVAQHFYAIQDEAGQISRVVILTEDITERKHLEQALIVERDLLEQRVVERTQALAAANARLQELDRLKSQFVSDVSHELRTPVTSLMLYLGLLERSGPHQQPHYLVNAKQQASRMKQLIEDILDLSRLEQDKADLALAPVDLNAVLEQALVAHMPHATDARLNISINLAADLPPARGDAHRLLQVATNLIANAVNYTSAGEVCIRSFQATDRVGFEVRDTGMGITPEDMPHLFERFYRGQRASQSSVRGTGLGLSIVKEIVNWLDGEVEVRSEVNMGSTFTVWLPAA